MTADPAASPPGFGTAFGPPERARRRPTLTREAIVDATVAILDHEGAAGLTVRRLAADLDSGAASIYWHVQGREALVDLALDRVIDPVRFPIEPLAADDPHRRASMVRRLRAVAVELHAIFGEHRWAALQMLSSRALGPNLLLLWERLSGVLEGGGLGDEDAFYAVSAVLSYVVGVAAQGATWAAPGDDREHDDLAGEIGAFLSSLDAATFPGLHRVGPIFARHDEDAQFLNGLDMLLAGVRLLPGG